MPDPAVVDRLTAGAAQVLPEGALAARLAEAERAGRPLRVKLGIDPSGMHLTLGHAVVLRKLRQFQDAGHLAVLIIGDFTGQVGDPSGRSATRSLLDAETTAANSATYLDQLMRVLDPDRVEVRRNSEWLATMTMSDVARAAAHLTVARLLERDDFARRFAAHEPISLVEFLYPLLQACDSVAVRADVELGGTDQTYNLLVGRQLQQAYGDPPQVVLTMPLLEGLDGSEKMGKSLDNFVAIDEPAAEQFGKLMSMPDHLVARYAQLCTDLPPGDIAAIAAQAAAGGPASATAKRRVAREIVALYGGADAAGAAEATFDRVHRDHQAPTEMAELKLPTTDSIHLPQLLIDAGFTISRAQSRREMQAGAVRLDGTRVDGDVLDFYREALAGKVLSVGRRRFVRLLG
ncbi:MAG: tyrosine--tRNA ligase [Mycobacteriales bacterium]